MPNKKYVGGKEASDILGIHQRTLYQWEAKGKIETIRTPGNKRLYNVAKFLKEKECKGTEECVEDLEKLENMGNKLNISYVRVSSRNQKDDLERQKKLVKNKYPKHIMIEDIGSGMNMNRRGLRKIIKLAIDGKVNEVVIAYKDRLARFGYDLIEDLLKEYSEAKIKVLKMKENIEPEEEIVQDVLQMMDIFVARMNGLRKYKKAKGMEKI